MEFRSLHHFSRQSLKGRYFRALRASWFLGMLRLLYRFLPAGLAGLLIVRGNLTSLCGGWLWMSFLLLWTLFWEALLFPVRCALWRRFGAWLGLTAMRTCFRSVREYARAARLLLLAGLVRLTAVLPLTAAGVTAFRLLQKSTAVPQAGWYLFSAVQAAAVMFWAAVLYLRLTVSLLPMPVLCTEFPQESAATLIRRSFRLMAGHHRDVWSITLCYLPALVTLLPMPFLLPRLYADLTLFLQVRIRESAQNGGLSCPI